MPPHLHPRSTATSTLFAGTLLASFIVVGIPHVFPCPRPRQGYADTEPQVDAEGRLIRRKRRKDHDDEKSVEGANRRPESKDDRKGSNLADEAMLFRQLQAEAEQLEREARACPVPKPKGLLGQLLGLQEKKGNVRQEAEAKVAGS